MKIYTMIKIDMATGKTIVEKSFEYNGALALAIGPVSNDNSNPNDYHSDTCIETTCPDGRTTIQCYDADGNFTIGTPPCDEDDRNDDENQKQNPNDKGVAISGSTNDSSGEGSSNIATNSSNSGSSTDTIGQYNIAKTMDLFVNKGYQIPGGSEGLKSLYEALHDGINAGCNYVTNQIREHWEYSTDFKARGYEAGRLIASDYYTDRLDDWAWNVTWSPTSLLIDDKDLGGRGGIINNIPIENKYAQAALILSWLTEFIYKDVTKPRGPSEDPLDLGGSINYFRYLNSPRPIP